MVLVFERLGRRGTRKERTRTQENTGKPLIIMKRRTGTARRGGNLPEEQRASLIGCGGWSVQKSEDFDSSWRNWKFRCLILV